ncbi:MAG: hypothetical protein H6667_01965 [Ardenticatenaceae bacterium]|nr:hypothetical protein [Ardenticatenaceae bacterium]MCB9443275.1 hypothetical protein [Ardenticatenaceae bacterium]
MTLFLETDSLPVTAWEGYLEPLGEALRGGGPLPRVSLGEPATWNVAAALQSELGKTWTPPDPALVYTLIRLSCTLHPPNDRGSRYTEVRLDAPLRVLNGPGQALAHDLFPMQQTVQDTGKIAVGLNPKLKFAKAIDVELLEVGVEKNYAATFPVVQAYGLGEANPYWLFRDHDQFPLQGSQKVYLLAAAPPDARLRLHLRLAAAVKPRRWDIVRYGLPPTAVTRLTFDIQ